MKVSIVGGTGFIGSYVVDALLARGHDLSLLVRPGSEDKIVQAERVRAVAGDLNDRDALGELLNGADAVIYLVGILRAFPRQGITFEHTQLDGVKSVASVAHESSVRRFLLMSANGIDSESTPYQQTKREAERHIEASDLDWTVIQPSVVFGDPRGRMEFATQLNEDIVRLPLPAIGFHTGFWPKAGPVLMSPVHVQDVALAFVQSLEDRSTIGRCYALGGPETLSWVDMIRRVAAAVGKKKTIVPMPIVLMRIAATFLDWLPFFPVTRDQLVMLAQGNVVSDAALRELIGRDPKAFIADNLAYLER